MRKIKKGIGRFCIKIRYLQSFAVLIQRDLGGFLVLTIRLGLVAEALLLQANNEAI